MASGIRGALAPIATQLGIFSVLKNRDFRIYWLGLLAQVGGLMMTNVTITWLAYEISGSAVFLGSVVLLIAVSQIGIALIGNVGGYLADRVDQRRLITITAAIAAANMATLAALTLSGNVQRWHLLVFAFVSGVVASFDQPGRQALYPRLFVDRASLAAAVSLNALTWQIIRLVGPSAAGLLIAYVGATRIQGAGSVFAIATAGSLTMIAFMVTMRMPPPAPRGKAGVFQGYAEGMRVAASTPVFRVCLLLAYVTAMFGMAYQWLLPVFIKDNGIGDARQLGWMWTASGIGSFAGVLTVPYIFRRFHTGWVTITQGSLFGVALLLFAATHSLWPAMAAAAFIGLASLGFMVGVEVTLQTMVSGPVRGRIMALYSVSWSLSPLGGFVLSPIADAANARTAIAAGGAVVLLAMAAVVLFGRTLRNLSVPSGAALPAPALNDPQPIPAALSR